MNSRRLFMASLPLVGLLMAKAEAKGVSSTWPEKPVTIDGRGTEWPLFPVQETDGFGFRAMNDGDHIYLLLSAVSDDARTLLAGTYRQDVTLWVLSSEKRRRLWGIRIPFSLRSGAAGVENPENSTLNSLGIAPQRVVQEGVEVSTAAWPNGVMLASDLSSLFGRKPVIELAIPLSLLDDAQKRNKFHLELSAEPVSPELKREAALELAEYRRSERPSSSEGKESGSSEKKDEGNGKERGRRGGRRGGHERGGSEGAEGRSGDMAQAISFPNAIKIKLTVGLKAHPPK